MPPAVTPDFINSILAQSTPEEQLAALAEAELLNAEGVSALLDLVETRLEADPQQAFDLVGLCQLAAQHANLAEVQPRATYLRGQLHAMRGEFAAALAMIDAARTGYDQQGMALESLRTHVGLMRVLGETGQYDKALAVGQHVLDVLGDSTTNNTTNNPPPETQQRSLLAAYVHANNGGCYTLMGRFADALRAYTNAEPLYRELTQTERLADLRLNQGVVSLYLGRVQDALLAYEEALQLYSNAGLTLGQALALINIGEGHLLLGNYMRSLQSFEQAAQVHDTMGRLADQPLLLRQLADAYLILNLYSEALDAYRNADVRLTEMGRLYDRGLCLWGMGMALAALARLDEAENALATAYEIFRSIGNAPLQAGVMLEQAALFHARGTIAQAQQVAQQARALVATGDWPVQRIYACLRMADLLLPEVAAVEPLLFEAQGILTALNLPHLRYRLNQRWGHLLAAMG